MCRIVQVANAHLAKCFWGFEPRGQFTVHTHAAKIITTSGEGVSRDNGIIGKRKSHPINTYHSGWGFPVNWGNGIKMTTWDRFPEGYLLMALNVTIMIRRLWNHLRWNLHCVRLRWRAHKMTEKSPLGKIKSTENNAALKWSRGACFMTLFSCKDNHYNICPAPWITLSNSMNKTTLICSGTTKWGFFRKWISKRISIQGQTMEILVMQPRRDLAYLFRPWQLFAWISGSDPQEPRRGLDFTELGLNPEPLLDYLK